jgi:hypothetical protein
LVNRNTPAAKRLPPIRNSRKFCAGLVDTEQRLAQGSPASPAWAAMAIKKPRQWQGLKGNAEA